MIEALAGEEIVRKAGGRFKLTALVQHRMRELMDGARPLVDRHGRTDMEVAIAEVLEGKIEAEFTDPKEHSAADELPDSPF